MKVRSEETRRNVVWQVTARRPHQAAIVVNVTLTATCQEEGSAAAVAEVFERFRRFIEDEAKESGLAKWGPGLDGTDR